MKWISKNLDSKKSPSIPYHCISRRGSALLISALLRYSIRRRKYECKQGTAGDQRVPSCDEITPSGEIQTQETCKARRTLTRAELIYLQTKLAVLSDSDGDRPIHIAVANENLNLIQKLCYLMMKNSISLDITNHLKQTPLHLAVILGNTEIIKFLLNSGASPVICDRNGNTVLHLAVKSRINNNALDILLSDAQVKIILNSIDYEGYSALHYAVSRNNTYAVKALQTSGADINKTDGKSGRTALIHAVLDKNASMVELLLKLGACPLKADYSGQNAYELSLQAADTPIIDLLRNRMPPLREVTSLKEQPPSSELSDKAKRTKNNN